MNAYLKDSSLLERRIYPEGHKEVYHDEYEIVLDRSWDGVYFCLNGYATFNASKVPQPLRWIISGDNIADEAQNLGCGPAYYLTPEQVKHVAAHLEKIPDADFIQGFDAEKMTAAKVYPGVWEDKKEVKEYLLYYYKLLKEFYLKAAEYDEAVISYIN
jgi:hypothetical protein